MQRALVAQAAEAAPVAMLVADEALQLLAANGAAPELLGYAREELLQLRVPELTLEPDAGTPLQETAADPTEGIAVLRHEDGSAVVVRYYAKRVQVANRILHVTMLVPRRIISGELTPQEIGGQAPRGRRGEGLSDRETEILLLLADGYDNLAIARSLFLSVDTVKSYIRRLLQKLGARSRTHAVAIAFRRGLLD